jgi:phage terminase large subunit-like protein
LTTFSPDVLRGNQLPRLFNVPEGVSSEGSDASEFAALCGLVLDPWQSYALECLLQQNADGSWVTKDGLIIVPRQNGKGALDEAWTLWRIFGRGVEGVVHTAQVATTAFDAFKKMRKRIEASEWLFSQLKPDRSNGIRVANGEWGFTFKSGQQINYRTRTGQGSGRGLTIDDLVLDEIQHITDEELDSLTSIILTKPYGQTIMTGSAPIPGKSEPLSRLVEAGRSGNPGLTYLEWSCEESQAHDLDNRELWAQANPGYGIRLFDQAFLSDRVKLSAEGFAREHLGIVQVDAGGIFPLGAWEACQDEFSAATGPVTLALEVSQDREWAAIGAAGKRPDGFFHVECVEYHRGTAWVVDWLAQRQFPVVIQPTTETGSLISGLEDRRVTVIRASEQDFRAACGQFYDSVADAGDVRHLGQSMLDISVSGARKKPSGDAWKWDRRTPITDVTPLTAVTLALWGSRRKKRAGGFMAF